MNNDYNFIGSYIMLSKVYCRLLTSVDEIPISSTDFKNAFWINAVHEFDYETIKIIFLLYKM